MKKITKQERIKKFDKIISIVFLLAVSVPLIVLIIQLILDKNFDTNKLLMIIVSILVLIAFFVPAFLEKRFNLNIPAPIYVSFLVFLYSSAILGEMRRFYYIYPFWDTILHFMSGIMLGILGFSIVYLLNKETKLVNLSPLFVVIFALSFATTCGVLWEIFEYLNDAILKTNMQKYMLENGTKLIGRIALKDTMNDLIINFIGCLIPTIIGYISLKKERKILNKFLITKNN